MGPGYVQGGTRVPQKAVWGALYSWNLWILGVLTRKTGRSRYSRIQYFRRWTALLPLGAGANMSAGFKSSALAICRQYSSFPIFG